MDYLFIPFIDYNKQYSVCVEIYKVVMPFEQ